MRMLVFIILSIFVYMYERLVVSLQEKYITPKA